MKKRGEPRHFLKGLPKEKSYSDYLKAAGYKKKGDMYIQTRKHGHIPLVEKKIVEGTQTELLVQ